MADTCVCCRVRSGVLATPRGGRGAIRLCQDCLAAGHRLECCLLCPAPRPRWQCAWLAHFAEAHPQVLAQLSHDPFPELAPRPSPLTYLGKLALGGR